MERRIYSWNICKKERNNFVKEEHLCKFKLLFNLKTMRV